MQHTLVPRPPTFEELLGRTVQELNWRLHARPNQYMFRGCCAEFAQRLIPLLTAAGYETSFDECGLHIANPPVHEEHPIASEFIDVKDWPTEFIVPRNELTVVNPEAFEMHIALKHGVYQTAWDGGCEIHITDKLLVNGLFVETPFGVLQKSNPEGIEVQYALLNGMIVEREQDVDVATMYLDSDQLHLEKHRQIVEEAGYTIEGADCTGPTFWVTVRRMPPERFLEWDVEQYERQLIPASVRLTNGRLLKLAVEFISRLENSGIGRKSIQLSADASSNDAFLDLLRAAGYQLTQVPEIMVNVTYPLWVVDLLASASSV